MGSLYLPDSVFDVIVLYPPRKIKHFVYQCGKKFVLDEVVQLYKQPEQLYGILKVHGESATIYTCNEFSEVLLISRKTAKIQKRQKKGGQGDDEAR